ncbi:uncharacterized protein LOC127753525 [Oryza glaberrima]|nr:uncharacterized protein LOC127753525 [Oryza glaberrima]
MQMPLPCHERSNTTQTKSRGNRGRHRQCAVRAPRLRSFPLLSRSAPRRAAPNTRTRALPSLPAQPSPALQPAEPGEARRAVAMAAAAEGEGEWGWMAEVAGEELEKLEAAHPGRFGPLKAELKRLIADPAAAAAATPLVSPHSDATVTSSSSQSDSVLRIVSTQESSSRKKRRCGGNGGAGGEQEGKRRRSAAAAAGKDRAEMAIERAERCLRRIRAFKASLLGFSD